MPRMYMIHGFTGVGKTTFSKKLEQDTGAVRISPDEWMIERHGTNPPIEKFQSYYDEIDRLIWKKIKQLIADGRDVIMDSGFWKRAQRDKARKFAQEHNVEATLYNLQCQEDVWRERVAKRTAEMPEGALFIDENALDIFKTRFEPLDPTTEPSINIATDQV